VLRSGWGNKAAMQCIGIEIGGTKLQLVLGNAQGQIHKRVRLKVDAASGAAGIRNQIETALPGLVAGNKIQALGVGFGGPVDWKNAKIRRSHQIEGWSDFDLSAWLQPIVGAPVVADNDANVAAFGEALQGTGVGFNPVFYVTLGSGVGGGLVVDGKIYHGAAPGEAEIGHVRLDRSGTIVEDRSSGWAVDLRIRELIKREPKSVLARLAAASAGGEAKHLAAAIATGDASAKEILRETATDLAFGLSHVVHLFHPEIIVLGGGLSGMGESLRGAVEEALRGFIMEAFAPGPRIALAALGEDAVPVGALRLAGLQRSQN
jgi:glucokinase